MNRLIAATMNRIVLVIISIVMIVVWGGASAFRMQRDYLPPINNPTLIVSLHAQDYQADQIHTTVLAPIEASVRKLDGLEGLEASSFDGGLLLSLYFPMNYDMSRAERDVTHALDRLSLPPGVDMPSVTRVSTNSFPMMRLSLTSPSGNVDETTLRTTVQAQVTNELKRLPGISDVRVTGAGRNGYVLSLRMADLSKNGLTLDEVKQSLADIHPLWMQGKITSKQVAIPLQAAGWKLSEQDLKQLPVRAADGHIVSLSAVADLSPSMVDLQTISRTDGTASVFFDVLKTPSADITQVSERVRSRIEQIRGVQPGDTKLSVLFDQGEQVKASLYGLFKEGVLGCLLSMVCVFLFFRHIRSTALIALSLPICLMATTGLLQAMGISLNILTVSGLIVAMGRAIDDTIVVLDNMYRRTQETRANASPLLLAEAVREMLPAIVASTATTVAVYLPIAIVGGMISSAFSGFAWSVVIALLTSLAVAILVVPTLYHFWYRGRRNESAVSIEPVAHKWLSWALLRKRKILAAFSVLLLVAGTGACLLPVNFLPANRSGQINVQLEFPAGTALTQVDAAVKRMEQTIKSNPNITTFSSVLGSSFTPQFDDVFDAGGGWIQSDNVANIAISLKKNSDTDTVKAALEKQLANISGSAVCTVTSQNISGDDSQLKINLTGADSATLDQAAKLVRSKLLSMQGLSVAGAADDKEAPPRFRLTVNRAAAEQAGVQPEDIDQRVRAYLSEGTRIEVTTGNPETIPVAIHTDRFAKVGSSSSAASDPQTEILTQLGKETFKANTGREFRLDELAALSPANGPTVLREREGRPFSVVTANIISRDVEKVSGQVNHMLAHLALPSGVHYAINGISAQVDQMIYQMGIALTVSALLVLFILSIVFKGWRAPLIVLSCIPLAYIGSILGMLASGGEWTLASLVGLLMLSGIAATNGIVLVDKVERLLVEGMNVREAILEGTASRVRPVLVTAGTTILTLLPLCFLGGSDTVVSQSLGIVVVCGMISSTVISLLVIPILYEWMHSHRAARLTVSKQEKLSASGTETPLQTS